MRLEVAVDLLNESFPNGRPLGLGRNSGSSSYPPEGTIRSRLAANGVLGIATSVRWKSMCFAWGKTFASISTSFTRKLVEFQLSIDRGNASCCREFPCLFANLIDRVASVLARRVAATVIGPRVSGVE